MMETWLQITCNGCGETGNSDLPNYTRGEYLKYNNKVYGWRHATGDLDYCRDCVKAGYLKNRVDIFVQEINHV